jgi:formylglycine-generating enzyme|eukprot:g3292.t1
MKARATTLPALAVYLFLSCAAGSEAPTLVKIPAGNFNMGYSRTPLPPTLSPSAKLFPNGDADEQPYHKVSISEFMLGAYEVTNAQFEEYMPGHSMYRNRLNFSKNDDDAVLWVSWHDAVGYCSWLTESYNRANPEASQKLRFRLPTEAEWEYAARGNSSTKYELFWTGGSVPKDMQNHNDENAGLPKPGDFTPTQVGRFKPNSFGLYDTLGNVEEWTNDAYAPYSSGESTDPQGPKSSSSNLRVSRGGSHGTELYYLRSSNRAAAISEERSWFIGFRVAADVVSDVLAPNDFSSAKRSLQSNGKRNGAIAARTESKGTVTFPVRKRYVNIPMPAGKSKLPFYDHNHDPTITTCPGKSGGLIASWFSTNCGEPGRCTGLAFARLGKEDEEWSDAQVDFDVADRTQCCPAYFFDKESGTLFQFSGMTAAGDWSGFYSDLIGVVRYSDDCGRTWAKSEIIWPFHGIEHQTVVTVIKSSRTGELLVPVDHWGVPPYGYEGDETVVQHNPFKSLADVLNQTKWQRGPLGHRGRYNNTGGHHSSIVELRNGSYFGASRGHPINGMLPVSLSNDGAHTWTSRASIFPFVHGGQRPVAIRLGAQEEPIMLCSFANEGMEVPCDSPRVKGGTRTADTTFPIRGLFCAVSEDDGDSWMNVRPITDNFTAAGTKVEGFDHVEFLMAYNSSEPNGYMDATFDERNGMIHLITSMNHYSFDLAYLKSPASCNPAAYEN